MRPKWGVRARETLREEGVHMLLLFLSNHLLCISVLHTFLYLLSPLFLPTFLLVAVYKSEERAMA
jgi:hypothetical protein